jgi:4-amino-4-deoxy-L-arabinose transferase-like glycosyltransferase
MVNGKNSPIPTNYQLPITNYQIKDFVAEKDKRNRFRSLQVLGIIWLLGAVCDRIWFALDHTMPAWDQAEYLTGSLNYWQALQNPQWLLGEWWTNFWMLSSKIPPLTYIATTPFLNLFGTGPDQATLVYLFFSAILLGSVYGLGAKLFTPQVGLWAAGLCVLFPGLYRVRLDFLLDYPLTAVVTLSFLCLTVLKEQRRSKNEKSLLHAAFCLLPSLAFGLSLGLALMTKQTALFFLLIPVVWVGVGAIRRRDWGRLAQLVGASLLSVAVFGWWYRTNWLLILTSGKRATVDSALAEGDPALNTLAAWTYYWKILPSLISWPLLLVPIVGLLIYWGQRRAKALARQDLKAKERIPSSTFDSELQNEQNPKLGWLAVFLVGAYLLSSVNINKDARYVLPYLPVLSVFLAYGITRWPGVLGKRIRWGTVGLATLLMFLNLYPLGGSWLTQSLSPNAQHSAYLGNIWPHKQVIDEIIKTEPLLRSNLGVLPSTGAVNQHNFNYYGALENFQVYGRQVGVRRKQVEQDARSLSWFLTKTGDQGSVPQEAQANIVKIIEQGPDFALHKSWSLPDGSNLNLYHRRIPPVQVQPVEEPLTAVRLVEVTVPEQSPPGAPVPVTYKWSGPWEQLKSGIVLLTWRLNLGLEKKSENPAAMLINEKPNNQKSTRWLHDRGIGMGNLHAIKEGKAGNSFQVTERLAMLPPADTATGTYTLEATYLNRETGESYSIPVPPVALKIDPAASIQPAPELDLVTQLRTMAADLPKGPDGLTPVFDRVGRINQYDPIQDYLKQAEQALEYRLRLEPQNREWAYNVALSKVLQRQVKGAIAALERVTQLDSKNPYAYAYLAFVHLYDWNPRAASAALKPALAMSKNQPYIEALDGAAGLMQGNLFKAWAAYQKIKDKIK